MSEHPQVVLVRDQLNSLKGSYHDVAKAAGLSYSWVCQFAQGKIKNPTVNSLHAVKTACESMNQN
jgi:transcriptional regulator with XRE-family HTH domain